MRVGPKVFFKSRLGGEVRLAVPSAPSLELGLVPLQQLGDAVEAVVVNPPLLAQVTLSLFEAGNPPCSHLTSECRPSLRAHLFVPPWARLSLH
jgi:hypothetical protein